MCEFGHTGGVSCDTDTMPCLLCDGGHAAGWLDKSWSRMPYACKLPCASRVRHIYIPHVSTRTSCNSIDLIGASDRMTDISPVKGLMIEHVARSIFPVTCDGGRQVRPFSGPKKVVARTMPALPALVDGATVEEVVVARAV